MPIQSVEEQGQIYYDAAKEQGEVFVTYATVEQADSARTEFVENGFAVNPPEPANTLRVKGGKEQRNAFVTVVRSHSAESVTRVA